MPAGRHRTGAVGPLWDPRGGWRRSPAPWFDQVAKVSHDVTFSVPTKRRTLWLRHAAHAAGSEIAGGGLAVEAPLLSIAFASRVHYTK